MAVKKVKQPVGGPGHSNVAVPGGEVMFTELATKVGSWCTQIFFLLHSLPDQFYLIRGVGGFPASEFTAYHCIFLNINLLALHSIR